MYYGWPTVVASRDDKHLVCGPMAFVELHPGEDEVRRPDDTVRFHGGLLHGSHFAAEDLDQAAPLLRRNIPSGDPTQVCELFEEIARVLRLPGEVHRLPSHGALLGDDRPVGAAQLRPGPSDV